MCGLERRQTWTSCRPRCRGFRASRSIGWHLGFLAGNWNKPIRTGGTFEHVQRPPYQSAQGNHGLPGLPHTCPGKELHTIRRHSRFSEFIRGPVQGTRAYKVFASCGESETVARRFLGDCCEEFAR